jgi:hypothetical protein
MEGGRYFPEFSFALKVQFTATERRVLDINRRDKSRPAGIFVRSLKII